MSSASAKPAEGQPRPRRTGSVCAVVPCFAGPATGTSARLPRRSAPLAGYGSPRARRRWPARDGGSGGLDRVDAFHGAGLVPFGFDDLESGGLDEGQMASGEVFTGCTDGDPFEEPLGGVDRRPGAADVVEQPQAATWDQDAFH